MFTRIVFYLWHSIVAGISGCVTVCCVCVGINTLMYIMSKMASSQETTSEIHHYERLEFLGDAVIEFLSRSQFSCAYQHTGC